MMDEKTKKNLTGEEKKRLKEKETERMDIEELLNEGKIIQIQPQGYSMYPLLFPGRDAVQIEKTDITKVKRGDVLLYRRKEGSLVLHRVYCRQKDGLYMVGDNQTEIEGPLALSQVRGKMIAVQRNGKSFSTANPFYVIFSRIWLILRPFRPVISKIIHKVRPFRDTN